jgi:hypothetical protein
MLERSDFFQVQTKIEIGKCQAQIKKCESLAAAAVDKSEHEFWVRLAHRWEELLRARQRDGMGDESCTGAGIVRPIFAKRPAA